MKLVPQPHARRRLVILPGLCIAALSALSTLSAAPLVGRAIVPQQDSSKSSPPQQAAAPPPSPVQPYDPYHAAKSLEIGTFYMKRGDLEAAIDRFQDAIRLKYDYARPRLLLAEIYEKKREYAEALRYYREYLQVYPHAPDAKHVRGRIGKLEKRLGAASSDS